MLFAARVTHSPRGFIVEGNTAVTENNITYLSNRAARSIMERLMVLNLVELKTKIYRRTNMKFEFEIPDWLAYALILVGSAEIGALVGAMIVSIIEAL